MSARRCGVCRKEYRGKGTLVRAGSKLARVRACPTCAKRGVVVVPGSPVTACKCGAPATTCAGCGNVGARKGAAASVAPILAMLDGLIKSYNATNSATLDVNDRSEGIEDGLTMARDRIASGSWS